MAEHAPLLLRFGAFELDEREARLTNAGRPVALAPKTLALLCALARRPAQLVRKDELLDAVWGHRFVTESVLKTAIRDLRAALGDDARAPRYVETAARHGYRFIATLGDAEAAADAQALAATVHPAPAADPRASAAFVGRAAARQQLQAAWAAAQQGRRQVVWLAGEAGIGKTTLIERFVADLGPVALAHGQCVEQRGAGEPYLPVLEAVSALCRADAALAALLRQVAPTWLLQLPWLAGESERDVLRRELAGSGQERMLREAGEWLDRVAERTPLLLVTEDLHWSDQATLRLIDHVARRRAPARLMWLASFRLAEVLAGDHPLKALRHELRLQRLAQEVALDSFSEVEVAEFIARRVPGERAPEAVVRELHLRTDGLPLFVARVVEDWQAQAAAAGALRWSEAASLPPPEGLAGVIEAQLQRLEEGERALLEAASVCGVEFAAGTLAAAVEQAREAVDERCERMVRRRQWLDGHALELRADGTTDTRYAFRHALVRQVCYQRIGAARRSQLHRRVAQALALRRDAGDAVTAAELALHHERGQDLAAALACYAEAAESALRRFAPSEALTITDHACGLLAAWPEGPARWALEIDLLGSRAVAASQTEGVTAPRARAIYERLEWLYEQLPAKASRALALGHGWSLFVAGEYARALERAERQLAEAERRGDVGLAVAVCNLYGAMLTYMGRLNEARDWLERGLSALPGLDGDIYGVLAVADIEVSLHARHAVLLAALGEVDSAERELRAAHARVDQVGQPYARRLALIFEGFVAIRLGQPERVGALAAEVQRIATEHAIAQAEGPARWMQGWALARRGDPRAGHTLIREGYAQDLRLGLRRGRSGVLALDAEALILDGRLDEAEDCIGEARRLADSMGERLHLPDLMLAHSRVHLARGDSALAQAQAQEAWHEAADQQALWPQLAAGLALCRIDPTPAHRQALAAARGRLGQGQGHELVLQIDALLAGAIAPQAGKPDRNPTRR